MTKQALSQVGTLVKIYEIFMTPFIIQNRIKSQVFYLLIVKTRLIRLLNLSFYKKPQNNWIKKMLALLKNELKRFIPILNPVL